jgi:hypothetical protein
MIFYFACSNGLESFGYLVFGWSGADPFPRVFGRGAVGAERL